MPGREYCGGHEHGHTGSLRHDVIQPRAGAVFHSTMPT